MSTTLTIDATGGAFIPAALLKTFALKPGAMLQADVGPEGIALRPVSEDCVEDGLTPEDVANGLSLINENGFLVITGLEPFNAVEAIAAAREERDEQLLAFRKQ